MKLNLQNTIEKQEYLDLQKAGFDELEGSELERWLERMLENKITMCEYNKNELKTEKDPRHIRAMRESVERLERQITIMTA